MFFNFKIKTLNLEQVFMRILNRSGLSYGDVYSRSLQMFVAISWHYSTKIWTDAQDHFTYTFDSSSKFCLTLFFSCQDIFIGSYLKLLETLRHPLIHLQILFHAVEGALLLLGPNFARREVGYAVDEADLGELVVRR